MAEQDVPQDENVIPHPSFDGQESGGIPSSNTMVMPHNLEAEQGLLGALMTDNSLMEKISDALREDHFYDPVHGRIFAAIESLDHAGNWQTMTLKSYFVGDAAFDQMDIENYLNDLTESVLFLSEALDYAEEIRQCYLRRSLIGVSDGIAHKARTADLDMTAETQIEEAEQQLFTLAESDQTQGGLTPFKEPLIKAIKMAEIARSTSGGMSGIWYRDYPPE